ncbi:MAG: single-stranded-DNA-specific exonuclease RecJ [Salibacteraceae bacterium]
MQEKRWLLKPIPAEEDIQHLKKAINASDALAKILVQRGLLDFHAVKTFFNPDLKQLHNPFLMKDMDVAVNRISDAIENQENILVYGDYDVDGTTAVSLLYDFLHQEYQNVSYYIPDRYKEGYGISTQGIDFAEDNGFSLIIALDCGIKANDKVAYANEKGIDFIICDHHLPGKQLPKAAAILNPLQADCKYPFKSLCGCGIGFKLAQALTISWNLDIETPFKYIDLVAIATGADIVPMIGENRILVYFGMRAMERLLRPGLAELLEKAGLAEKARLSKHEMTVSDMVFKIGPRINAAGRMEHGSIAVELLTAKTSSHAQDFAALLNQHNQDRRDEDKKLLEEAMEMMDKTPEKASYKSTVLFASHWHKGVIGIAASRIQDHYYRPTIILTESNGMASGSARSVKGFDVHAAIEECSDLLINFGGHPAAAGMTLDKHNIEAFRKRFEATVTAQIKEEQLSPCIDIDLEIDFEEITPKFYNQLNRIAPFGPHNMRPVFVTHNLKDTGKSRSVGEDKSHLKLEVQPIDNGQQIMSGIAFGFGHLAEKLKKAGSFSLVYSLETNDFKGKRTTQLMIKDIRIDE